MRWLLVVGVSFGMACGSSGASTEAPDGGVGGASVDAAPPADAGSLDGAPTDASADAALPPLGCLTLPTWQLPALKPSLPVTPKLLWRKRVEQLHGSAVAGFLVRSGGQLAVSYRQLFVFDLDGNRLWQSNYPWQDIALSGVSADTDGNYYQFADKLYSYSPTGQIRWTAAFPGLTWDGASFATVPLVRGNSDLFFRSSDSHIWRVDAKTGRAVWTSAVPAGVRSLTSLGLFLSDGYGTALDPTSGGTSSISGDSRQIVPVALSHVASVWGFERRQSSPVAAQFDACGRNLGPSEQVGLSVPVIDMQGRFWTGPDGSYHGLSVAGERSRDRSDQPAAVGADGTLFSVSYITTNGTTTSVVRGTDSNGVNTWQVAVLGVIDGLGVTLGEDGVLHAVEVANDGLYLVAVQTTSPGLGDTPLPAVRNDNRRSGWPKAH